MSFPKSLFARAHRFFCPTSEDTSSRNRLYDVLRFVPEVNNDLKASVVCQSLLDPGCSDMSGGGGERSDEGRANIARRQRRRRCLRGAGRLLLKGQLTVAERRDGELEYIFAKLVIFHRLWSCAARNAATPAQTGCRSALEHRRLVQY